MIKRVLVVLAGSIVTALIDMSLGINLPFGLGLIHKISYMVYGLFIYKVFEND